jgi:hypothetical protein
LGCHLKEVSALAKAKRHQIGLVKQLGVEPLLNLLKHPSGHVAGYFAFGPGGHDQAISKPRDEAGAPNFVDGWGQAHALGDGAPLGQ